MSIARQRPHPDEHEWLTSTVCTFCIWCRQVKEIYKVYDPLTGTYTPIDQAVVDGEHWGTRGY